MNIDLQDSKTKIILLGAFVVWTIFAVVCSIYIYRQVFVLPWKGVIRDAETKNVLNLDELQEKDQVIVKMLYELAKKKPDERGHAWELILNALNDEGGYVSPLDGKEYFDARSDSSVFAVMIENSPEVMNQQRGLENAAIVWHYPTEGAIGRVMAIFRAEDVKSDIGPIRSTRPYYLDIAGTFDGISLVHAGGSPKALQTLPTLPIIDIDENMHGVMYRDVNYYAPHNLYLDEKAMLAFMETENVNVNIPSSLFSFNEDLTASEQLDMVTLNSLVTPKVEYTWEGDHFERVQDGTVSKRTDGEPLPIKNVVILSAVVTQIQGDDQGRVEVELINNTKAKILRGGQVFETDFSYNLQNNEFLFEFEGAPFELMPGQTWVEVMPEDATIEIRDIV